MGCSPINRAVPSIRGSSSIGAGSRHKPSSLLDSHRARREQQIATRLRLATHRLDDAQCERIWAIVEAHQSGLSVRQIAAATGLSSSRVHQLLGSDEVREIPR